MTIARIPVIEADGSRKYYNVFHRTWWKRNPSWPDGREPHPGKKHYFAKGVSYGIALQIAQEWNATHDPGELSDKAEFEEE